MASNLRRQDTRYTIVLNLKLIYKVIGSLLFLEAFMLLICLVTSICYGEQDILAFSLSMAITIVAGAVLRFLGRDADTAMSLRDAFLLVSTTWTVFSLFGSLPFMLCGHVTNFTDAFFETMAGFTTTGCSVIDNVDSLPHAVLLWRSITQWLGGLGIVMFTIAVLPSMVDSSVRMFSAEESGSRWGKMRPRMATMTKYILGIYIGLNVICAGVYWLLGMDVFDSVNHSMTTVSTGGFSTHNASMAFFNSHSIDTATIIFSIIGAMSFSLLYVVLFKGRFREIIGNTELRFFIGTIIVATAIIAVFMVAGSHYAVGEAIHNALFQVVAFVTSTGFFNDDATRWPHLTWAVLSICMFVGGCAGSTSGGIKCLRVVTVFKVIANQFTKKLHPRAVLPVKVNGITINASEQIDVFAFIAVYIVLCLIATMLLVFMGVDSTNAFTVALSSACNGGAAIGPQIGNTMSWASLPLMGKWLCAALMLLGRLEVFNVLVIFTRAFWKDN